MIKQINEMKVENKSITRFSSVKNNSILSKLNHFFIETWTIIIPTGVILMMYLMPIEISRDVAIIYISGNFITSISNLCITSLAQRLIGIRTKNGFEHLATLPIYRASPLLGTFFSTGVVTLPSLVIMPIIGVMLFKITFYVSGWLILIILLSIVLMTGLGAIIGTCSNDFNKSQTVTMIIMFFVMFATPVYYSLNALPFGIQIFQRLLPFSYALEAMRLLMKDSVLSSVVIRDILVLIGYVVLSLALTAKFFSWKNKD